MYDILLKWKGEEEGKKIEREKGVRKGKSVEKQRKKDPFSTQSDMDGREKKLPVNLARMQVH